MSAYNLTAIRDATDANEDNVAWLLCPQGEVHKPIAIIDDEAMKKAVKSWLFLHPVDAKAMSNKFV